MNFLKLLFFLCFISCKSEKEIEKYQIINLLYHNYSKQNTEFFVFPKRKLFTSYDSTFKSIVDYTRAFKDSVYADSIRNVLEEKISSEDSLKRINTYLSKKENQQIFAFDLKMEKYHNFKNKKFSTIGYDSLFLEFIDSREQDSFVLKKLIPINNDSLIIYNKQYFTDNIGLDFENFNVLISFSNVIFNNTFSKAIIVGTIGFSKSDFHSTIYFLEKKINKWIIKFEIPI